MKSLMFAAAAGVLAAGLGRAEPAGAAWEKDGRVEFRVCPKCDKRIRIDLGAGRAYVNLARLEGACRGRDARQAR